MNELNKLNALITKKEIQIQSCKKEILAHKAYFKNLWSTYTVQAGLIVIPPLIVGFQIGNARVPMKQKLNHYMKYIFLTLLSQLKKGFF